MVLVKLKGAIAWAVLSCRVGDVWPRVWSYQKLSGRERQHQYGPSIVGMGLAGLKSHHGCFRELVVQRQVPTGTPLQGKIPAV